MRTVISVSLSKEMAEELDAFAKASGRNKSDIIKESLSIFLWETRFRNMRKNFSRKAKAKGFITDEDIFKAVS